MVRVPRMAICLYGKYKGHVQACAQSRSGQIRQLLSGSAVAAVAGSSRVRQTTEMRACSSTLHNPRLGTIGRGGHGNKLMARDRTAACHELNYTRFPGRSVLTSHAACLPQKWLLTPRAPPLSLASAAPKPVSVFSSRAAKMVNSFSR